MGDLYYGDFLSSQVHFGLNCEKEKHRRKKETRIQQKVGFNPNKGSLKYRNSFASKKVTKTICFQIFWQKISYEEIRFQ